jgi:hypothetical protein
VIPPEPTLPPVSAPPVPEGKKLEPSQVQEAKENGTIPDGAGPNLGLPKAPEMTSLTVNGPKPVEVTSVPQTPANDGTPAGGTPRPELKIAEEPEKVGGSPAADTSEPLPMAGVQEPAPTPKSFLPTEDSIPEPIIDKPASLGTNGVTSKPAEMTGALPSDSITEPEPLITQPPSEPVTEMPMSAPSLPKEPLAAVIPQVADKPSAGEPATGDKRKLEEPPPAPVPAPASLPSDTVMEDAPPLPSSDGPTLPNAVAGATNDGPDQKRAKPNGEPATATISAPAPAPVNEISAPPPAAPEPIAEKPTMTEAPVAPPAPAPAAVAEKPAPTEVLAASAAPAAAAVPAQSTNPPKVGRPRKGSKESRPPVPVGRTARKTRSQGPIE